MGRERTDRRSPPRGERADRSARRKKRNMTRRSLAILFGVVFIHKINLPSPDPNSFQLVRHKIMIYAADWG